MEGLSIIIPVYNRVESTLRCIDAVTELNAACPIEIIIVDNGSTDETPQALSTAPYAERVVYFRNEENLGVSKALNRGCRAARCALLCCMHNDLFLYRKNWAARIAEFILGAERPGVIGLYGARTMREDGSFWGRTIVHSLKDRPSLSGDAESVVVVDGVLMAMKKTAYEAAGGFDEEFPVHFYDKDMSMRMLSRGFINYVINIPFEHSCAVTRTQICDDDEIRDRAQERFMTIWHDHLPADVTTWWERIMLSLKKKGSGE